MTPDEAEAYLLQFPSFAALGGKAYAPGLERIEALMQGMGNPHEALRVAHVAGTNGKGSTASMLASIGVAAGRRVGLHTSPHLYRLHERMRIDGIAISGVRLATLVSRNRVLFEEVRPSFFEITVALSLLYFAEEGVDEAVIEVGLGGRLDATNIVVPAVCVVTTIGLEHTAFLGETLEAIAAEKAGIIKPGVPVVCGVEPAEVAAVIRRRADACGAPYHGLDEEVELGDVATSAAGTTMDVVTPIRTHAGLFVPLPGRFQARNAALAVRTAEVFWDEEVRDTGRPVFEGLRAVRRFAGLRGRLEVLSREPLIVQDVGHNHDGLSVSLAFMNEQIERQGGRLSVAFGVMRDKSVDRMAELLKSARAEVILVPIPGERAWPARELLSFLQGFGLEVRQAMHVDEAIAGFREHAAPGDGLLITGSHLVAAQVDKALRS